MSSDVPPAIAKLINDSKAAVAISVQALEEAEEELARNRVAQAKLEVELHETRRRVDAAAASWAADRAALIARAEDAEHALSEAQMRVMEIELGVVQAPANAPSTAAWEYGAQEEARERYRELEDDLGDAEAKVQSLLIERAGLVAALQAEKQWADSWRAFAAKKGIDVSRLQNLEEQLADSETYAAECEVRSNHVVNQLQGELEKQSWAVERCQMLEMLIEETVADHKRVAEQAEAQALLVASLEEEKEVLLERLDELEERAEMDAAGIEGRGFAESGKLAAEVARLRGDLSKANAATQKLASELLQTRAELSDAVSNGGAVASSSSSSWWEGAVGVSGGGASAAATAAAIGGGVASEDDVEKRRLREEMDAVREEAVALLLESSSRAEGLVGPEGPQGSSGGDGAGRGAAGGGRGGGGRPQGTSAPAVRTIKASAGDVAAAACAAVTPGSASPGAVGGAVMRVCETASTTGTAAETARAAAKDVLGRMCNIAPGV